MIRLAFAIDLRYEIAEQSADFAFNIHAARTACQTVVSEQLAITPPVGHVLQADPALGNRCLRRGYRRVQAIHDWVRVRATFTSGTSNSSSSAPHTLGKQVGACRDFAHPTIALCRAAFACRETVAAGAPARNPR